MATGLALLSMLPAHPTAFDIVWRLLICGIGFGFFNTPNNRAILTSAPRCAPAQQAACRRRRVYSARAWARRWSR